MKDFADMLGHTIVAIDGACKGSDRIVFTLLDGTKCALYHMQDCCESVEIEDIVGDISDLLGEPLLLAEEATSRDDPVGYVTENQYRDSFTWTFYRLATRKGHVDIRWLGQSNGYYSERVDFITTDDEHSAWMFE